MEGQESQNERLILAQKLFLLKHPDVEEVELKYEILSFIKSNCMVSLYKTLVSRKVFKLNQSVLDTMQRNIEDELKKLNAKIADAEENLGESEVREAHLAKSLFYIRIGTKDKALKQLKLTLSKTVGVAQKLDLVFDILQVGFFHKDFNLISEGIDQAKNLLEEGGDWERKNRLNVYEGLFCICTRNFRKAACLFLDSISTFTAYELLPYDTFIYYTVLMSIITLDRISLKQKVEDAPGILAVIGKFTHLTELLYCLFACEYKTFYKTIAALEKQMEYDRYLCLYPRYYIRDVTAMVYSQFLESYESDTIEEMAKAFGVKAAKIDLELCDYVACGLVHCKNDKGARIIEGYCSDGHKGKNVQSQATNNQRHLLQHEVLKLRPVNHRGLWRCVI